MSHIPGFSGLFIAGVFSASLSSLSTALNSAAAVILEDFWKPNARNELSERKTSFIMRATVFIFGAVSVLLVPVVQKLGGVLQLGISLTSASFGPLFGLFFSGFFLPWIKAKGALIGASISLLLSMYIAVRGQAAQASGELVYDIRATSVEGCSYSFITPNSTRSVDMELSEPDSFQFHHISFHYYSFLGTLVTIIIGYVVTFMDNDTDPSSVDPNLLAPFLSKYFNSKGKDVCDGNKMEVIEHLFEVKKIIN